MPFDNPHYALNGDLQILIDARDRISGQDSWLKHSFKDGDHHCLIGALSVACGSRSLNAPNRTERRLTRVLAKQLPLRAPWWTSISPMPARLRLTWWNDELRTTHEEVLALYDRAISALATTVSDHVHA